MAMTIKEMADNYVNGFHPSIKKMCNESYTDGVNAVLEEIVRFMEDSCAVNFKSFKAISNKIKELKGE